MPLIRGKKTTEIAEQIRGDDLTRVQWPAAERRGRRTDLGEERRSDGPQGTDALKLLQWRVKDLDEEPSRTHNRCRRVNLRRPCPQLRGPARLSSDDPPLDCESARETQRARKTDLTRIRLRSVRTTRAMSTAQPFYKPIQSNSILLYAWPIYDP
jgi:hypothetical protein